MSETSGLTQKNASVFAVFKTFLVLGLTSFGGPVAHLGYFRKELVEKQQWVNEHQYAQLLAICQFLPGPASSQVGFVMGLLRAGWLGAILAFIGFTLPSVFILVAFASVYPYLSSELALGAIHGLKLVACAVVADALWSMFSKLCTDVKTRLIAGVVLLLLILTDSPWIQLFAVGFGGLMGMLFCQKDKSETGFDLKVNYSAKFGALLLTLFFALLLFTLLSQQTSGLMGVGQIFYQAGALVFGGGHVVLPLLQESIVGNQLMDNQAFIAGYGASQAIPGPMFAFAAYLGALMPVSQGPMLGAMVAIVFMFLPGFLLVAGVLPIWQIIAKNSLAKTAIIGVNAAVVGVLAAAFYHPIISSSIGSFLDVCIAVIGIVLLTHFKRSPLIVVLWCVLASMLVTLT